MASTSRKRKRCVLSIEENLNIIKKIDQGCSLLSIATEFGVGKTTVYEEEEEEDNITQPTVTHTEAEAAFSICLSWLEQQAKATPMNLMLLRDLHLLSSSKKYNSLKQRTITDYFKPA